MSDTRTVHLIGHGHIDPTWLWRWTEGYEEVRATFRSALDRMNETPEFRFTASSACFYDWVRACDPEMFDEIRRRVAEGRWDLAGGWWIEPDCNIPCGESIVRQGFYGQRFFREHFGRMAEVGFNPDSFGHAGTFPQILNKLGLRYYMYQRPGPEHEMNYPEGIVFRWRAKDGSEVLATTILFSYNGEDENFWRILNGTLSSPYLIKEQQVIVCFYGVGNHGGGPTKQVIREILERRGDAALPELRMSTLAEYFRHLEQATPAAHIGCIAQDLQHHARGCYSVHAEIKRLNRRCEQALMTAERISTAMRFGFGRSYPKTEIESAWKDLLYNQFHDILAGTSIESSYEDARDQLGRCRHTANVIVNESIQALARRIDTTPEGNTVVVFNPLPWPRRVPTAAPWIASRAIEGPLCIVDDAGAPVPAQAVHGDRIDGTAHAFVAEVPGLGYRCYHVRGGAAAQASANLLEAAQHFIENAWWRLEVDPYSGAICRLYDKRHAVEVLREGNVLAAMVDGSDTWSHDVKAWRVEAGRFRAERIELHEQGPVRATIRVVSRHGASLVDQAITLYRDVPQIDCTFRVNWQERYQMLKLGYVTAIAGGEVACDTAYGCEFRKQDGEEQPCQQWVDLSGTIDGQRYGLAVLNDSKYGFDARDGVLRMTLLRSPAYAYHDPARHEASEPWPIMDQGWRRVAIRLVPHAEAWHEIDLARQAWELNQPPIVHVESAHAGALPASLSFLECEADNVLLSVFKAAEEGEALIVRGYESCGRAAKAEVRFPNLGGAVALSFAAHEIKTVRIDPRTWSVTEVNLLESPPSDAAS